jgi:hypothetical protein
MALRTGIVSPLLLQDVRQLSTKHQKCKAPGPAVALTLGTQVLPWTTIDVITILCPKRGHTVSLAPQSPFLNTVKSHFSCGTNTYKKSPMNLSQHYKKCLQGNNLVSCPKSNQNWHSPTLPTKEHSRAQCKNGCYPRMTSKGCLLFPPLNKGWNTGWTMPPLPMQSGASWILPQSWQPLTRLPNGSSNRPNGHICA